MDTFVLVVLVVYAIAGGVTYMAADVQGLARRIESMSFAIMYSMAIGVASGAVFFLWPLWWMGVFGKGEERG